MQNYPSVTFHHKLALASLLILCVCIFNACGFQLRGTTSLSFKTLYIQGNKLSITRDLERAVKGNGAEIVSSAEQAEFVLELLGESNQKRILSLSGGGLVRQFELDYSVNFRMREAANPIWGQVQNVIYRRAYSYNDNELLGKEQEEARLNEGMRRDAIREILRRLSAIKPTAK